MEEIQNLRRRIDEIDRRIVELLNSRMKLVKEIGKIKKQLGLNVKDVEREREVIKRSGKYSEIFKCIVELSREIQAEEV